MQNKNVYVCGAQLFPDSHKYANILVVRMSLSCESVMESAYYSSKSITFPEVRYHCRGRLGRALCNNSEIRQLRKEVSKVRPICLCCYHDDKRPVTQGPSNNVAKKKK